MSSDNAAVENTREYLIVTLAALKREVARMQTALDELDAEAIAYYTWYMTDNPNGIIPWDEPQWEDLNDDQKQYCRQRASEIDRSYYKDRSTPRRSTSPSLRCR